MRHLRSTGVKGAMDTMVLDGERKKLILRRINERKDSIVYVSNVKTIVQFRPC